MKMKIFPRFLRFVKPNLIAACLLFFIQGGLFAQLATFPLRTPTGANNNTPSGQAQVSLTSPNVVTGTLISNTSMLANSYNSTGYRVKITTTAWATSRTDGYGFDIPIGPATGWDMNITGLSLDVTYIDFDVTGSFFTIVPYFQIDGAGAWMPLTAPKTVTTISTVNFGPLNETFYSGHTYAVRFYVFNSDGATSAKNDEMRVMNLVFTGTTYQPIAQPATVTTTSGTATGKYTATGIGQYSFNGTQFYLVKQSGFIWTTGSAAALAALDTSAATKTTNGAAGVINSNITGLSAGTTYWARAYIVTQFGIQYGATVSFTTDAPSAPVVVTQPITNVLSNKATGGGVITDSGGVAITAKGFVWNIGGGATLASNIGKLILNGGAASFTDFMKQLAPNTTYCYRAYATNSLGTSYGADVCFTTGAPVPVLVAVPGIIDFGNNFFGANPITVSYILTGSFLTPATGTITINIPPTAGFKISTSSGSGFGSTISLPYSGGALPRTPIFVQFPTTQYGTFSASVLHSGGGVAAADADTVKLKGIVVQSPDDVTNKGNDFWLGFGYQNKMKQAAGSGSEPFLTVYVAAGSQPASVTVDMPGIAGAYSQSFNIPANSTHAFTGFPQGTVPGVDARLSATGVSNRGIHVYSTNGAPISVWEYIATTGNSAGGSMIFPTTTWNSNYTVQAYAGKSNNGLPNSFFFVIANEDNTVVKITPSSGIIDPSQALLDNPTVLYPANVPFTITLNKGQVFNAIGQITGSGNAATSAGFDLSGTTVSTVCDKKIAVFGGNGRCMVTTPVQCTESSVSAGSDNMIQQMIPSVAWDTKYFTVPTKTMEHNLFRIYVRNVADTVWVNDAAHTAASALLKTPGIHPGGSFFNGNYTFQAFANSTGGFYALETSYPMQIDGNQPISVTQFITAGDCATNPTVTGNNGQGDPEMIILTGAQQAITNAVVYSPSFQNGASGAGYINVVIPAAGVNTFRLDLATNPTQMVDTGRSSFIAGAAYQNATAIPIANAFKPYPSSPGYFWAKFKVSYPTTHVMSSTVPFNAIAYGVANGESYGFNAGTAVKNLSSYKISVNPQGTDSSSTVIRTCVNTPITLKIAFPYNPSSVNRVEWAANDARVSPNNVLTGATNAGVAVYNGTVDIGGRTFYIYTSPVAYTFAANGLYNFKVTAFGTFASDCPGEDQQTMLVNVGQDILNLAAASSCNNPTVTFSADTIPMVGTNILSWSWDFGDGPTVTTGNITPQSHTYPTGGATAYTVKLTTKNTVGCLSTDSIQIDFGGGLEAVFTKSKDTVCTNQPVTFTDGSFGSGTSGSPNSWQWDFGDGLTHNGQTPPPQTYTIPGIKTVALTVSTAIGCVKTFKDTVVVEATPVAAINPNPTFVCLGDSAAYADASTIAIGSVSSWLWTFDDGTTSTLKNPKHLWATSGSHTVTLTVKSAGACSSSNTATHTINVNPLPTPGFSYSLNCTTRQIVFTDTSNGHGSAITNWTWDFGDGNVSNLQNPTHTYAASGTFIITLAVTTANGCKSSPLLSKTITIAASPVADFTLPGTTCLPSASPVFTNTSTISDGTPLTYTWNFGDGTGDLQSPPLAASPIHVFPGTGPYTVSLTAISNNGCTNTTTKSYSAIYTAPVAVITPLTDACVNSTVNFSSASSTAAGSSVTGWSWDFGDGNTSALQNPTHTYNSAGVKTVTLTVTSAAGCVSAAVSSTVTINALPTASFTDTVNCSTFSAGFTSTSVANSGTINSWAWTFGDVTNNTSTVENPTHVYPASGTYNVTLTVKNDKGCSSSVPFAANVVIAARPATDFTLPGNTCLPAANALFTNNTTISDGTIASVTYNWNFGDGTILSTPPVPVSPSHLYTATGTYTVTLTATSVNGCTKSVSKTYDKVFAQPSAVITAPAGGVCLGNVANFSSALSTAPGSTVNGWSWDFGDTQNNTSTAQNPSHTYGTGGPKTVTLTVTSAAGCTSTAVTQAVNVNLSPVAAFTYSAIRCEDSVITFNDASVSNATGGITEWKWNFGDGGTLTQTTLAPATHTFANAQSYTVSLSVKNANGCLSAAAFSTPVVINPNPVSRFTVSNICIPNGLAQFTHQATIGSGQVRNWSWDFGVAGATSAAQNPTYNYTTGGIYTATLKVTSDSGCSATTPLQVTAYNNPTPLFDVTNVAGLCSNLPVSIVNKTVVTGFGSVDKIELYWDYLGTPTVKTTVNNPALDAEFTHQYPVFGNVPAKSYRVLIRAFSGSGCSTDYFTDINVLASPKALFTQPAPVCQEVTPFVLAGGSDQFSLPGIGEFSGTGVVTSPTFSPAGAGAGSHVIRYTYTTNTGCVDFTEKTIVVNPTPVINFGATTINVLEGDVLQLAPSISNGNTYLWTPARFLNNATIPSPMATPTDDITYTLQVTSSKTCVAQTSVNVKVVKKYIVPNTFTPNGDQINDTWVIENLSLYPDVRVRVFNRGGQMVFENYGYNTPWNGKYKGADLPFGTYYYVIETGGGRKPQTGYVTILR